jgi:hypothetical protein
LYGRPESAGGPQRPWPDCAYLHAERRSPASRWSCSTSSTWSCIATGVSRHAVLRRIIYKRENSSQSRIATVPAVRGDLEDPELKPGLGVNDPRKAGFHSLRHSMSDALRRAGVPEEHKDAILGHSRERGTALWARAWAGAVGEVVGEGEVCVPEHEQQRALMGHGATGVADGYGLGFPMSVLRDAVEQITY